jgi:hypothetical protein
MGKRLNLANSICSVSIFSLIISIFSLKYCSVHLGSIVVHVSAYCRKKEMLNLDAYNYISASAT